MIVSRLWQRPLHDRLWKLLMVGEKSTAHSQLAPRRVRLFLFAVLVVIAIGAIWLIDRRAMQRQIELDALSAQPAATP